MAHLFQYVHLHLLLSSDVFNIKTIDKKYINTDIMCCMLREGTLDPNLSVFEVFFSQTDNFFESVLPLMLQKSFQRHRAEL